MKSKTYEWGPILQKYTVTKQHFSEWWPHVDAANIEYKKRLAGHVKYQVGFNDELKLIFSNIFAPYFDDYLRIYSERYNGKHFDGLQLESLWINHMQQYDYNQPHIHAGHLSFVYYVQIPNELIAEAHAYQGQGGAPGDVIFIYGENSYINHPPSQICEHQCSPRAGDLYIFPAMMRHAVLPFKSPCTRVSMSGNLSFKSPVE